MSVWGRGHAPNHPPRAEALEARVGSCGMAPPTVPAHPHRQGSVGLGAWTRPQSSTPCGGPGGPGGFMRHGAPNLPSPPPPHRKCRFGGVDTPPMIHLRWPWRPGWVHAAWRPQPSQPTPTAREVSVWGRGHAPNHPPRAVALAARVGSCGMAPSTFPAHPHRTGSVGLGAWTRPQSSTPCGGPGGLGGLMRHGAPNLPNPPPPPGKCRFGGVRPGSPPGADRPSPQNGNRVSRIRARSERGAPGVT